MKQQSAINESYIYLHMDIQRQGRWGGKSVIRKGEIGVARGGGEVGKGGNDSADAQSASRLKAGCRGEDVGSLGENEINESLYHYKHPHLHPHHLIPAAAAALYLHASLFLKLTVFFAGDNTTICVCLLYIRKNI
ncbi:unnamed protein product [Cuscuta europaea]|uniref:Uncharacterized protein n=1 Tax=Cuscuta europaea TaxID=41803 RepID=A0A9P0ZY78_CUSEU|nr:unnamed protein product [Cuscuta europaea]